MAEDQAAVVDRLGWMVGHAVEVLMADGVTWFDGMFIGVESTGTLLVQNEAGKRRHFPSTAQIQTRHEPHGNSVAHEPTEVEASGPRPNKTPGSVATSTEASTIRRTTTRIRPVSNASTSSST